MKHKQYLSAVEEIKSIYLQQPEEEQDITLLIHKAAIDPSKENSKELDEAVETIKRNSLLSSAVDDAVNQLSPYTYRSEQSLSRQASIKAEIVQVEVALDRHIQINGENPNNNLVIAARSDLECNLKGLKLELEGLEAVEISPHPMSPSELYEMQVGLGLRKPIGHFTRNR